MKKKGRKYSKKNRGVKKRGENFLKKSRGREKRGRKYCIKNMGGEKKERKFYKISRGEKMIENVEEIFKITLVNLRFVEFLILKISKPFFRPRVIKKLKLKKENNILKDNKNGNDDQSYNIIDKSNEKKNFFC